MGGVSRYQRDQAADGCAGELRRAFGRGAGGQDRGRIAPPVQPARAAMEQAREEAALPDLPELPEWQAPDVPMPAALYDSTDTFYTNTRRMQKAKLRDEDEEPDEDQEEDEE